MEKEYLFSYTTGSLMIHETKIVIDEYMKHKDWTIISNKVLQENILQKNSLATRKKFYRELKMRVESLSDEYLNFIFAKATSADLKHLIFLANLKAYRFIYEFIVEVIYKKVLLFDYKILNSDYETFFESKKLAVIQLEKISESTNKKLKQVMFRMFEEVGLIDSAKNKNIQKFHLSQEVIELIAKDEPMYLKAFLYTDYEIEKFKERYL